MNKDLNILIVDDNPENLRVVSTFLQPEGYKISLAFDGQGALDILKSHPIDLILLDVMMPDISGFELCAKIKSKKDWSHIPIIFLTAKNETESIVKGFEVGGADYVSKPFNPPELSARVKNHIALKLMRDHLVLQVDSNRSSRNEMMKMLLDMGRMIEHQ
jgi:two-component system sensor histidine kinase/response regulator